MTQNPFYHTAPIRRREHFYDRRHETAQALEKLRHLQSVSITGPRKIGKTSLLFHLRDETIQTGAGLNPDDYVFIYVNCEGLGGLSAEELYTLMFEEIVDGLAERASELAWPEVSGRITVPELNRFLRQVRRQGTKLILALDEFEWISRNQRLDSDFFSALRALSQHLAFVTTSQLPLIVLPHTELYSPFFNVFTHLPLGLFSLADSRALIEGYLSRTDLTLEPETIDLILELGGQHPFFLQTVGYYAYELRRLAGRPLQAADYRLLKEHARLQMDQHFQYAWEHLDAHQRYALATLPLNQTAAHLQPTFRQLAGQALLVPDGEGWRFFSPLFQEFVCAQPVEKVVSTGPFLLELEQKQALRDSQPLELSPSQFALLAYLIQHRERVVTHAELDREIWQPFNPASELELEADTERVKSMIKHLRKALGPDSQCIVTVRGVGYAFRL